MSAASRLLTVLTTTAALVLTGAATAFADSPTGSEWEAGHTVDWSIVWTILIGFPAAGFVLLTLFGLLTARNNYVPPSPSSELATAPGKDAAHH